MLVFTWKSLFQTDHKEIPRLFQNFSKIPGLSRTLFKFQDFPGLLGTMNNDNLEFLNELCVDDSMSMEEIESYFKDQGIENQIQANP